MKKLFLLSFFCMATVAISLAQLKVLPTSGNVGIGILSPSTILHLKGLTPFITLENTNSSKIWQMGINSSDFWIVDGYYGTRLCIKNTTGNVGINTSSNLYSALNVNGGINITSADSAYRISNNPILRVKGTGNLFVGSEAGKNTSGNYNTFNGFQAGYTNSTGTYSTFMGYQSGYSNTTGSYNTFEGYKAGNLNVNGEQNTFLGNVAGMKNTGSYNTSVGSYAGYNNTGPYNVFMGQQAGYYSSTDTGSTFIGFHAGWTNATGSYNTLLGYGANVRTAYLTNATAIGNGAIAQNSNYVRIGNGAVTTSWVNVAWTIGSDGRFKFNIQENVKGLDFINKLRPVTYQMNTQQLDNFIIQNMSDSIKIMHQTGMDFAPSTAVVHSGFIAQEVDSAANLSGFISSIVHKPTSSDDIYGLSYAEIVDPLVKAVQELNATITQQGLEIQTLKARLDECCKAVIPATGN